MGNPRKGGLLKDQETITEELLPQAEIEEENFPENALYPPPYFIMNGCLYMEKTTKTSVSLVQLCNFAPKILEILTVDNGAEQTRRYVISGTDESGTELPPVEVPATELEKMDWMLNQWDASCDVCVVPQVEKHIRYAIKSTSKLAEKRWIFAHTGWRKVDGKWQYLLPGNESFTVELHGKQRGYMTEMNYTDEDLAHLSGFLEVDFIPFEIMYPCLALVFLSPLNEFLRKIGHEPKFVLMLLGRTGSMKSTVAALMLSFFGHFSATDLPMSFRDTANSIIHNAFTLKDVLTCIDDYHPSGRRESESMRITMQTIARGYGDRAARNRMAPDIVLREAHPPRGNVIVTAEFAPDIGESGTARLFILEMKPKSLNLPILSEMQEKAANGMLMRCLFAYTSWLEKTFLADEETEAKFLNDLGRKYGQARTAWRTRLKEKNITFHDRLPDTLACLEIGFSFFLTFLRATFMLKIDEEDYANHFTEILLSHASRQATAVEQDKPTHIFVRKFCALLESGHATVVPVNHPFDSLPSNCFGYEDDEYYYLFFEVTHKAVKKFCTEQDECFSISSKALGKALAEEKFIQADHGEHTKTMRFGGKSKRVMLLDKARIREQTDGV